MKSYVWFFVVLLVGITTLACASEQPLGALATDCKPVSAAIHGEIDPTWTADVSVGQEYELHVESLTPDFPLTRMTVRISIYAIGEEGREQILEGPDDSTRTFQVVVPFTAPETGKVLITILSFIGEYGEKAGDINVALCEI
jgi:hypothetical protein